MNRKTLAIIDDSRLARAMMAAFIANKKPEWNIVQFDSGDRMLADIGEKTIDFAAIDYNMPGIDGLTLAATLKEQMPAIGVVLVTANIQESLQQRAQALGVRFLSKPVTQEKVAEVFGDW